MNYYLSVIIYININVLFSKLSDSKLISRFVDTSTGIALTSLDLSGNMLTADGLNDMLPTLTSNTTLINFSLFGNQIKANGLSQLLRALQYSSVSLLDVGNNGIFSSLV